jgi:lipoprotein-anchoring transpeptidase ErfK/SrfK
MLKSIRNYLIYNKIFLLSTIFVVIIISSSCGKNENTVQETQTVHTTVPVAATTATPVQLTAEPTPVPTPSPTPTAHVSAPDDGRPWYVRVDTYNQLVSVYALDENSEYTRLINQFMCSAGKRDNYTKKIFQQLNDDDRYRWKFFSTFGGGYCEYVTRIYKPFLFHSVMFEKKDEDTLMEETYALLTFPDSHGCIRLMPQDAKWIYDNCIEDTFVEVVDGKADPDLLQSYMPPPLIDGKKVPVHEPFSGEKKVPAVQPNWDNFPSDGGWKYDPEVYE